MSSSERYYNLTHITRLNGQNYHDWKFAISMVLRAKGCWDIVSGILKKEDATGGGDWDKKSDEGLTTIALTVDASQYTYIWDCATGPAAWTALKNIYEKNSRATRISLKRQFYGFEHDKDTPMSHYVNGITDLAAKLKAIGVTLTDEEITDVLIFNLHNDYSSIATSLTAAKEELAISDVTGALLEEERRRGGPDFSEGAVSLMANKYGDGNGPPGRRGPHRDQRDRSADHRTCYRCGRTGHIAQHCRAIRTVDGKDIIGAKETSSFAIQVNNSLNDICY